MFCRHRQKPCPAVTRRLDSLSPVADVSDNRADMRIIADDRHPRASRQQGFVNRPADRQTQELEGRHACSVTERTAKIFMRRQPCKAGHAWQETRSIRQSTAKKPGCCIQMGAAAPVGGRQAGSGHVQDRAGR
jgi:hypothetical protein